MVEGWQQTSLGQVIDLHYGKSLPSTKRIDSGNVNVYGSNGIVGRHNKALVKGGHVIVGRKGSVGKIHFEPNESWPIDTTFYVPSSPKYDVRFLAAFLSTLGFEGMNSDAAVPGLNRHSALALEVIIPPLSEQRNISSVLSIIENRHELNRQMNETLEAMARSLFRDWFVDFGPTHRKAAGETDPVKILGQAIPSPEKATTIAALFPDAIGDDGLPEGWEERVLHDLSDWINGAAYKNMHFSEDEDALPVVKIAELKAGVTKTTKFTSTALGEKYRIVDGEVLFSWSGNPDTSIDTFIWSGGDAWLNQHIFAVRPNGAVELSVLYFMLKFLRPQFAEIARDKQTTGLGHVTKQDLRSMRICLGNDELLLQATQLLEPMFQKIYANQLENKSLAKMRDLLLPKLMSGEIRLIDGDVS